MNRCRTCCIPDTRPDTPFDETGQCSACKSYAARPAIDWGARKKELEALLERGRNASGFDCIVPSSGGKDSTAQVLTLIELGARPLVVTATTCHLTREGRANIDNLARYATTLEVTPNREVRKKLNRLGLSLVGDISWPEHAGIFTTPLRVAALYGIPLIFYGENPQNQYGGPQGSDEARTMTRRWVTEFGGWLGLRPADFVGKDGISERDMADYSLPADAAVKKAKVEAHFLGQYLPWDSHANAEKAISAGMTQRQDRKTGEVVPPCEANWWTWENLDNYSTGIHDFGCYIKYGYGRACAQLSVDVRTGKISREDAMSVVRERDGLFPHKYMGLDFAAILGHIGMSATEFDLIIDRFTNKALFAHTENGRPILQEFAE